MTATSSRLAELPSLTGLRFWAAFSILLNHLLLGFVARDNPILSNGLSLCGVLGMNVFFILSGFIIHYNYHAKLRDFRLRSFYEFMVARFSRLFPLFIVFFVVELTTFGGFSRYTMNELLFTLPLFLTMSQSWFYHNVGATPVPVAHMYDRISIAWSISTEFLMYCGYPLLLYFTLRDRLSIAARAALCFGAWIGLSLLMRYAINEITLFDAFAVRLFGPSAASTGNYVASFHFWLTSRSPYFLFLEFTMGVLAAHLYLTMQSRQVGETESLVMPLAGVASLAMILIFLLPLSSRPEWAGTLFRTVGFYPFIACIIFVCARYDFSALTKFFEIRFFVFFGEVSYSMYLIHIFFYGMVSIALANPYMQVLQIVTLWAYIFCCSYILYTALEMPARRWLKDLLTRPLKKGDAPSSAGLSHLADDGSGEGFGPS